MEMRRLILKVLQNKLLDAENNTVPVVVRHYPLDKTPCITINSEGGKPKDLPFKTIEQMTVSEGHPDYDSENPDKLVPQEMYYQKTNDIIIINIWYTYKEDGNTLLEQIQNELLKARVGYYTYCVNFNDGICSTTGETCLATTVKNGLGTKGFCPDPDNLNYSSLLFNEHYIIPTTFKIEATYNQDEYTEEQTLYRCIIKLNVDYYKSYRIGGRAFNNENYEWED